MFIYQFCLVIFITVIVSHAFKVDDAEKGEFMFLDDKISGIKTAQGSGCMDITTDQLTCDCSVYKSFYECTEQCEIDTCRSIYEQCLKFVTCDSVSHALKSNAAEQGQIISLDDEGSGGQTAEGSGCMDLTTDQLNCDCSVYKSFYECTEQCDADTCRSLYGQCLQVVQCIPDSQSDTEKPLSDTAASHSSNNGIYIGVGSVVAVTIMIVVFAITARVVTKKRETLQVSKQKNENKPVDIVGSNAYVEDRVYEEPIGQKTHINNVTYALSDAEICGKPNNQYETIDYGHI